MKKLVLALVLMASSAGAVEIPCEKPPYPECAFDPTVQLSEPALRECFAKMKALHEQQIDYRDCLWDFRGRVTFEVENRMINMVNEMAAYRQFSKCQIAAGPSATLEDIKRCPVPDFAER